MSTPIGVEKIGEISAEVKSILELSFAVGTPIYIGQSNIEHMEKSHPKEYERYFGHLSEIISFPDFIGINKKDNSIEYVKIFVADSGKYLKVAVRISNDGYLFARSLYEIQERTIVAREAKGVLHRLTKPGK